MSEVLKVKKVTELTDQERAGTDASILHTIKKGFVRYVAVGGQFNGVVDWYGGDLANFADRLRYFGRKFEIEQENPK